MPRSTRGHEVIEHTADVGLRVWAPDLGELFAEAAVALMAVMGEPATQRALRVEVSIDAPDLDALFVDWLSEILFLFEARELVPLESRVVVSQDPWHVSAEIDGVGAEGFRQTGPAVKAVTYHGLVLRSALDGSEARVYLDV